MVTRALKGLGTTCVFAMLLGGTAQAATGDIVLYASDAKNLHGNWALAADPGAAGAQKMASADKGWSSPDNVLASPADYFEASFQANAATPYHVWVRLRAASDSKFNDSVYVQFSDAISSSGSALYRIGTTNGLVVNLQSCNGCQLAGWGWLDGAYWMTQTSTVQFSATGTHTLRVQTREDGVQVDQIVLSPSTYLTTPPGPKVADNNTIVSKSVMIAAPPPAPARPVSSSYPFLGTAMAIPGTIQAEDFDNGGEALGYHDLSAGNAGGAYRATNVDIEATSQGGYDVGWVSAGEWLAYSVKATIGGSYLLQASVACAGQGGTFHVESNGTNVTGPMTIPNTGDWQTWATISKSITLPAGAQVLKIVFDAVGTSAAVGNVDWLQLSLNGSNPYSGTAIALPGTFSAANFDQGSEGIAYYDTSAGNAGGAYRSTDVDIESSTIGGYDVGWISAGEWLAYSVNVLTAGNYTVRVQVASPYATGTLHAEFSGTSTASVAVPKTGDWQMWSSVTLSATLASGPQTMKLVFDTGGFNVAGVTVAAVPVAVTTSIVPTSTKTSTSTSSPTTSTTTSSTTTASITAPVAAPTTTTTTTTPTPTTTPAPATSPSVASTTTGTVILVHAGDDLQAAINRAVSGDVLMLDAGATFTGNFILPVKSGTDFVTIRSAAADSSLPGSTTRIAPSYSALLPKLKSPNSLPALATDPGAHHYRLVALEFLANPQGYYDMLDLGDGSSSQNTLASVPHDLVLDRLYMHGDPTIGQKRAIGLNSASTTIQNCYISEIKASGQDTQAIAGWNGPGPYTITNNYLEAAGENVLFGGADPAIRNLVPSNITISGNYITKQLSWRGKGWGVKNGLELKNAAHVLITGNTIENSWVDGQMGALVLFTVRDQDGTAPWSTITDVTFANNVVRHGASFTSVLGYDDDPVARPSVRMVGLTIYDNLIYDIDPQKWNDPVSGAWGLGRLFQILGGPRTVSILHNTVLGGTPNTSTTLNGAFMIGQIGDTYKTEGLIMQNNVMAEGEYGVLGDTVGIGTVALNTYAPGWVFTDNLIIRGPSNGNYDYPTSTTVTPANATVIDPSSYGVTSSFSSSPTTDGKTIGADMATLRAAIPGLDLTK